MSNAESSNGSLPILRLSSTLAAEIGLNESIVLMQLQFLTETSYIEISGEKWTRGTLPYLVEKYFPFFSVATLSRVIHKLEDDELIRIGNFNNAGFDRTQWFYVDLEKCRNLKGFYIFQNEKCILQNDVMHPRKMQDASSQNETTIHENKRKNKRESIKESTTDVVDGANAPPAAVQPVTENKPKRKSKHEDSINELFGYWKTRLGHPNALLGGKRRKALRLRLTEGYTVEQLRKAIDGCARFPDFNGRRYDELEMIMANEQQVEKFMLFADLPDGASQNGNNAKSNSNSRQDHSAVKSAPHGYRTPKPVDALTQAGLLAMPGAGLDSHGKGGEALSMSTAQDYESGATESPDEVREAEIIPIKAASGFTPETSGGYLLN